MHMGCIQAHHMQDSVETFLISDNGPKRESWHMTPMATLERQSPNENAYSSDPTNQNAAVSPLGPEATWKKMMSDNQGTDL